MIIENREQTQKIVNPLLSTREVAVIFGVHPNTIRRWCRKGRILADRIGSKGVLMYRREEIAIYYLDMAIKAFLKDEPILKKLA